MATATLQTARDLTARLDAGLADIRDMILEIAWIQEEMGDIEINAELQEFRDSIETAIGKIDDAADRLINYAKTV